VIIGKPAKALFPGGSIYKRKQKHLPSRDITVYSDIFGKNEKKVKMLLKEDGNVEIVFSFTDTLSKRKLIYTLLAMPIFHP
jgi:hypothetical protein